MVVHHSQSFPSSVCKLTWIALKVNVFLYQLLNSLPNFRLCSSNADWTLSTNAVFIHGKAWHVFFVLVGSMHFIRRWRRPPSLSRVNSAATTNRRSSSRAGGLPCSFSNTTAATRSLAGWSPTTAGLLLPWCSTNWGRDSDTTGIYSHKLAQGMWQEAECTHTSTSPID